MKNIYRHLYQDKYGFPSAAISFISASKGNLASYLTGYLKIKFKNISSDSPTYLSPPPLHPPNICIHIYIIYINIYIYIIYIYIYIYISSRYVNIENIWIQKFIALGYWPINIVWQSLPWPLILCPSIGKKVITNWKKCHPVILNHMYPLN